MKKFSKRKKAWLEKIKEEQKYGLDDAIVLLKEFSKLKFNSTVDVIFLLQALILVKGAASHLLFCQKEAVVLPNLFLILAFL